MGQSFFYFNENKWSWEKSKIILFVKIKNYNFYVDTLIKFQLLLFKGPENLQSSSQPQGYT